ncbi:MAG: GNAT family N-acetyltransferase [Candidatus Diapherotrites archaeon]|nr:GNAT family N-acetyltransferase [Candidatus Diapherotrites archaeon]
MNAIFVEDAWRDQGIAKRLIAQLVNQCKHKRIQKLFLLVKETNEDAKALYKKTGFKFEKMHDKIIEDTPVEVWGQAV